MRIPRHSTITILLNKRTVTIKMNKKKNNDPVEPIEELTDAMHATFTISDENDKKYRVWSAMGMNERHGYSIEDALRLQQVTFADYVRYKDTRSKGWDNINGFTY